ncbi:MAG: uracil-DNA glycosylase [Mogibacterium sp.]|nr:uracil-DNA glycosylase [Mogibacterium sp.]
MVHIGNDWDEVLAGEFDKEYYLQLRQFLIREYRTQTVYPGMYDIFNALKYTAYQDVKVVILGQDPYHEPGQAHGLAFSVQPGVPQPPSLVNILKELQNDLGIAPPPYDNGCLIPWAKSGVLLLNTSLTVRAHQAGSHRGKGWEQLTDRIISVLNEREKPIVFILWGANAKSKEPLITNAADPDLAWAGLSAGRHLVITGPHPSPLSAHRGFFGGRYFSRANDFLTTHGLEPVDWDLSH